MKLVLFACILAFAAAAPERDALILRDDRFQPGDGSYSFDFETENGITRSEGGTPEGQAQAVVSSGQIEYPMPNGETFIMKFVANENGYQPESPFLPVAPAFPHEIPDFVLRQIAFAEQQRQGRV